MPPTLEKNVSASARERAIAIAIQAHVPTLIWGPPGAGKTSFVNQLGGRLNRHVETVIASIREPSDFAGLPFRDGGEVKLAPPSWAKRIIELAAAGKPSLLFFDEITTTSPATQAALLRVILDRVVGDIKLPESCAIVAAANPPEIAAGGWELALPLLNRFFHIEWELVHERWCEGIVKGFDMFELPLIPDNWRDAVPFWKLKIAEFIRRKPTNLLRVPDRADSSTRAFPTPRTWEMAATLCAAARSVDSSVELLAFLTGAVGTGAGIEFNTHVDQNDLTDPKELLNNPFSYQHIQSPDKRNALLEGVVNMALRNGTKTALKSAIQVLFMACSQAKRPGEFTGFVSRLAQGAQHNILGLIEDPQLRDYFLAHFQQEMSIAQGKPLP